ncbi:MAG: adenylate/guanylate cyclase domain-containing protein [Pirellulales bacterium]
MGEPLDSVPPKSWPIGHEGPLDCTIMFVDLVSSSEFASILSLEEYARFVEAFQDVCRKQCRYFFERPQALPYDPQGDYSFNCTGDELVAFLHTGRPQNDVYQAICLAIALKCAWLTSAQNVDRIANGMGSAELAIGINHGKVWAKRTASGFELCGFAINLGKRVESISRTGERFRIFVSDIAFKQVNRRMRNLIFGSRQVLPMKGVIVPVGVYEVYESFVNVLQRLEPTYGERFLAVAVQAMRLNSLDLWINSCLQVVNEAKSGSVNDDMLEICKQVLNIDAKNAISLYYAAQGLKERGDLETGRLYLEELTCHWPHLADGWLELGRIHLALDRKSDAIRAIRQARRLGVAESEEPLPRE